jgi:predicted aspartyl protease
MMTSRWTGAAMLLAGVAVCLAASPLEAEFYKYTDKSGRTVYVDEVWKIPAEYQNQVGRYAEKFDHLPEDQKTQAVESDQERQRTLELEHQLQNELLLRELRVREDLDRQRQAEIERKNKLKAMETRVTITNNQIIVPVSFSNGGLEAATQLILDTGATHTVIYRSFASQLNILSLAAGQSKVASGQSVFSEVGKVDSMKVGPIQARDFPVIIMSFDGPPAFYSGLLGMDFLSRVEYVLDYENQVIRWKLRGN